MSRYLILLILNLPLIFIGVVNSFVKYKTSKLSKRRLIYQYLVWFSIIIGLLLAEPFYLFLFSNDLTATESLSLFDVIQITGIISLLLMAHRGREKSEALEQRLQELHRELSIKLSEQNSTKKEIG